MMNMHMKVGFLVTPIFGKPIYQLQNKLWTSLSLTQQKLKIITGIIGDGMGIK